MLVCRAATFPEGIRGTLFKRDKYTPRIFHFLAKFGDQYEHQTRSSDQDERNHHTSGTTNTELKFKSNETTATAEQQSPKDQDKENHDQHQALDPCWRKNSLEATWYMNA